jgi:hypothetical protein
MIEPARLRGVYALIDPAAHAEPVAYLDALLRGGIRLVQIRAKGGVAAPLLRALVERIRAAGGIAIVNDDVGLALSADGVHLGQEDALLRNAGRGACRRAGRCRLSRRRADLRDRVQARRGGTDRRQRRAGRRRRHAAAGRGNRRHRPRIAAART